MTFISAIYSHPLLRSVRRTTIHIVITLSILGFPHFIFIFYIESSVHVQSHEKKHQTVPMTVQIVLLDI